MITYPQIKKIYALSREKDIDNETLHLFVESLTSKNSIKSLSLLEGKLVIDNLIGDTKRAKNMISYRQERYITALLKEIKWTLEDGSINQKRLRGFLKSQYKVESLNWLKSCEASKLIEALKAMRDRELEDENE